MVKGMNQGSKVNGQGPPPRENIWLSMGLNIFIPAFILMKGEGLFERGLKLLPGDPSLIVFVVALAFPLSYFVYDRRKRRKWNFFSIIGMISVFLTGGIGLLRMDPAWIAIKEAGIPALFAIAILLSAFTSKPVFKIILSRPEIFQVQTIARALSASGKEAEFDRILRATTLFLALSFTISAVLNFVLASIIVQSPGGTPSFNDELGRLTLWSMPVIVLPSMIMMMGAIFFIAHKLKRFTGLDLESIVIDPSNSPAHPTSPEKKISPDK